MKKLLKFMSFVMIVAVIGIIGGIEADTITLQAGRVLLPIYIVAFGLLSWISGAWRTDYE